MGDSFRESLQRVLPDSDREVIDRIDLFRDLVVLENEKQNLSRLTSEVDFLEGHVLDVVELLKGQQVEYPAMDLGSGVGVPGIIAAILGSGPWVLAESEGRKADFLRSSVDRLGLSNVEVFCGRGEEYLRDHSVGSVVARAVGPVSRIYCWIEKCSTWNNIVLLKGPGWETEWAEFQKTRYRKKLEIESTHRYEVGKENKRRVVVRLCRVGR